MSSSHCIRRHPTAARQMPQQSSGSRIWQFWDQGIYFNILSTRDSLLTDSFGIVCGLRIEYDLEGRKGTTMKCTWSYLGHEMDILASVPTRTETWWEYRLPTSAAMAGTVSGHGESAWSTGVGPGDCSPHRFRFPGFAQLNPLMGHSACRLCMGYLRMSRWLDHNSVLRRKKHDRSYFS